MLRIFLIFKYKNQSIMRVTFYKTFWKQWRWRIQSGNNKIVGASTESFFNKEDCEHNARLNMKALMMHFGETA